MKLTARPLSTSTSTRVAQVSGQSCGHAPLNQIVLPAVVAMMPILSCGQSPFCTLAEDWRKCTCFPALVAGEAAFDVNRLSGDPVRVRTAQEGDHFRHVSRHSY